MIENLWPSLPISDSDVKCCGNMCPVNGIISSQFCSIHVRCSIKKSLEFTMAIQINRFFKKKKKKVCTYVLVLYYVAFIQQYIIETANKFGAFRF